MFSSGGSFKETDLLLSGQATKAILKMNSYLHKFTDLSPKHTLELFDKLILPILNYGSEVWGFHNGIHTERTQLNFCKRLLGVKTSTQNNFVFTNEDDGYMMTYVYKPETDTSYMAILDASDFAGDPVAEIHVPRRVVAGFHTNWIADKPS